MDGRVEDCFGVLYHFDELMVVTTFGVHPSTRPRSGLQS